MHFDPLDSPGPEGILPVQFFRLSGASSPEKRLLLAVLEAALLDFRKGVDARTRRARRAGAAASLQVEQRPLEHGQHQPLLGRQRGGGPEELLGQDRLRYDPGALRVSEREVDHRVGAHGGMPF